MQKGITPVIAIVLLLLITVGAVGTIYSLTNDIMKSQDPGNEIETGLNTKLSIVGASQEPDGINLYVKNIGDQAVNSSDLILYYSDENKKAPYSAYKSVKGFDSFQKLSDYRMDGSGQTVRDYTGNGYDGELAGGSSSPDRVSSDCARGSCLHFDGRDDFVDLRINPMNPSPDRTKMAWVKLENLTSYSGDGDERQGIVSMEDWNPGDMHLHVENKKFGYSMKTNTGDANKRTDPVLNEWVNLAATYNSDTGKIALYVNGEEKVSEITETGLDVQPDDFIGAEFVGNDRNFNGSIDEVRVYNAALNEDQLDIAMYGPSNCFNDSKLIKPGDTYSCTTGVGIPDAGESISFTVSGPSDTKSWEYTCYGSATGDSCQ